MRSFTMVSIVVLGAAALAVGAASAQPGPNGRNDFGLCRAYFSGSEQGRQAKRKAPPFAELERQACEQAGGCDTEEDVENAVMDFCMNATPGGK